MSEPALAVDAEALRPGGEPAHSGRHGLVRAEHERASRVKTGGEAIPDRALEVGVEVREREIPAEDEVEGAARGLVPDIVVCERDASRELRPQAEEPVALGERPAPPRLRDVSPP